MSIRFRLRRRRRGDAFARRFPISPLNQSPSDHPPAMWLPPLHPMTPENAPVGINIGAFKPQRELERAFWPGPPPGAREQSAPWQPPLAPPAHGWRLRGAALGVARVLVIAGVAAIPIMF